MPLFPTGAVHQFESFNGYAAHDQDDNPVAVHVTHEAERDYPSVGIWLVATQLYDAGATSPVKVTTTDMKNAGF